MNVFVCDKTFAFLEVMPYGGSGSVITTVYLCNRSWIQIHLDTVLFFITTALKTVKDYTAKKPACFRSENSKPCDIHQLGLLVEYGPLLSQRGGMWPLPRNLSHEPFMVAHDYAMKYAYYVYITIFTLLLGIY